MQCLYSLNFPVVWTLKTWKLILNAKVEKSTGIGTLTTIRRQRFYFNICYAKSMNDLLIDRGGVKKYSSTLDSKIFLCSNYRIPQRIDVPRVRYTYI